MSQTTKNLTFTTFDFYYCGLLYDIELKLSDGTLVSHDLENITESIGFKWLLMTNKIEIEVNGNLTQ